jgi:small subunit ribosomal protein S12
LLTKQQSFNKKNRFRKHIKKAFVLRGHPHKMGFVDKIRITTPRKPNSAKRKTVRVCYYRFIKRSVSYVPCGDHNLKKNFKVLVRGRGPRDTPGVYTSCLRGKLDLEALLYKTKRRSIYGIQKKFINKNYKI